MTVDERVWGQREEFMRRAEVAESRVRELEAEAAGWQRTLEDATAEIARLREAIGPTMAIVDVAELARLVAREKAALADVADLRGRINRARVALNPNGEEPDR